MLWQLGAPSLQCDELVIGRIGDCDLSRGCFTFVEVCSIAAGDLVRTGRARQVEAALLSGATVRALLRKLYGVTAAPEWDAAAERRAFLRTLRVVRLRAVN